MEALERERAQREKDEAALAATMQNSKLKLLNAMAEEEAKMDSAVRQMQELKGKEKEVLISSLSNGNFVEATTTT